MKIKRSKVETVLCILLACSAIISSLIGLLYRDDGVRFAVDNIYGQSVELYGNGIYAYNSILTVSGRLGADWMGLFGGILLIFLLFQDANKLWIPILMTAQIVMFTYYFASLIFSISMNRLYLFYVFGFGLSFFLSLSFVSRYFQNIGVKERAKTKEHFGLTRCLGISGGAIILIWLFMLIPYFISQDYGDLLGVLSTEATFAIDLGIIGPSMMICSIWISKKEDKGYLLAPILLYILFSVGPMVILQNIYAIVLGMDIPIPAFISLVLSFVVMGGFALVYFIKSLHLLSIGDKKVRGILAENNK